MASETLRHPPLAREGGGGGVGVGEHEPIARESIVAVRRAMQQTNATNETFQIFIYLCNVAATGKTKTCLMPTKLDFQ